MIVCLSWGSLVWSPRNLKLSSGWYTDGPLIPVEFARQSNDGRLTLVINKKFTFFNSLWASLEVTNLDNAVENLAKREGTINNYIEKWEKGQKSPEIIPDLSYWAKEHDAIAAIWTALPPKFNEETGRIPTTQEALNYLENLNQEKKIRAEEYVRKAPRQIRTPYRLEFEKYFGWYPYE